MSSSCPWVFSEHGDPRIDVAARARESGIEECEVSRSLREIQARGFAEADPQDPGIYIVRYDRIRQAAYEAGVATEEFMGTWPDAQSENPRVP